MLVEFSVEKATHTLVSLDGFRRKVCPLERGFDDEIRLILISRHVAPIPLVNEAEIAIERVVQVFSQSNDNLDDEDEEDDDDEEEKSESKNYRTHEKGINC